MDQIRILLYEKRLIQLEIANIYDVSKSCIGFINTGHTWNS